MTNQEIADMSGLARSTVCWLSKQTKWDGISLDTYEKFIAACGVDPLNAMSKHWRLFRRYQKGEVKLDYIENANYSQRQMINRILTDLHNQRPH